MSMAFADWRNDQARSYKRSRARKAVTWGLPAEDIIYVAFVDSITFELPPFPRFHHFPPNRSQTTLTIDDPKFLTLELETSHQQVLIPIQATFWGRSKTCHGIMSLVRHGHCRYFPESLFSDLVQAEDQAKAADKNNYPLSTNGVLWILLVGPYWTVKNFGSFTEAQMTVNFVHQCFCDKRKNMTDNDHIEHPRYVYNLIYKIPILRPE